MDCIHMVLFVSQHSSNHRHVHTLVAMTTLQGATISSNVVIIHTCTLTHARLHIINCQMVYNKTGGCFAAADMFVWCIQVSCRISGFVHLVESGVTQNYMDDSMHTLISSCNNVHFPSGVKTSIVKVPIPLKQLVAPCQKPL